MKLILVCALDLDRLIGNHGKLPWPFLPKDHAHVLEQLEGRKAIMGRKSYDTPDRFWSNEGNLVITSQPNYTVDPGFETVSSVQEALERYKDEAEVVVLGGAEIYAQTIDKADILELTHIQGRFVGDAYFPTFHTDDFIIVNREEHPADPDHAVSYSFVTYWRK